MLKNFISFKKISFFICNFISLICSFQQCQCCECGNVSMGFWKSRVKQKSFVKSLVCDSWLNKTFVSLVISKTPYSHFLLTAFTHCWKIEAILLWNNLSCKVRVMAQFLNQCTHMWLHWLLLGTCDYIDCNIEVNTRLSSKSQCTHMWLHWLLMSHLRKLNY